MASTDIHILFNILLVYIIKYGMPINCEELSYQLMLTLTWDIPDWYNNKSILQPKENGAKKLNKIGR